MFVVFCMAVDTTSRKGIVGSHDNTLKCFKFLLEQVLYVNTNNVSHSCFRKNISFQSDFYFQVKCLLHV